MRSLYQFCYLKKGLKIVVQKNRQFQITKQSSTYNWNIHNKEY